MKVKKLVVEMILDPNDSMATGEYAAKLGEDIIEFVNQTQRVACLSRSYVEDTTMEAEIG